MLHRYLGTDYRIAQQSVFKNSKTIELLQVKSEISEIFLAFFDNFDILLAWQISNIKIFKTILCPMGSQRPLPWTHSSPQGRPDPGCLAPFQQILDPPLIYHNYHGLMHPRPRVDPDIVKINFDRLLIFTK